MTVVLRVGDCREILRTLPDGSVHCCVTSPPYFGLRDYGTAKWDGGDPTCDHRWFNDYPSTLHGTCKAQVDGKFFRDRCGMCGAQRIDRQTGLEPTPEGFVKELVGVFREVRRVLRADGTLWLNLGDSYASTPSGGNGMQSSGLQGGKGSQSEFRKATPNKSVPAGLKPKDLIGIPWRVAFALQADGWYLRQDIIWSKPNPMPESVTDRCTKSHEYIFLLSKNARYYYDADAIKEPASYPEGPGNIRPIKGADRPGFEIRGGFGKGPMPSDTRNKRSVWEVTTQPFSEAHFATFPPALIEPCILAGCPEGGTVLDPFGGAGTVGLVADRLNRNALLIELNPNYMEMAKRRIFDDAPLFADIKEKAADF